jgi:hypothetical protein
MGGVSHPRLGLVSWKVTILIFSTILSKLTPLPFARYGFTASLVSLILEAGYQSPHRTIDEYVEAFTCFRPMDGKHWSDREPDLPSNFIRDRVTKLDFNKMSESSCFPDLTVSNCLQPLSPSIGVAQADTLGSTLHSDMLGSPLHNDTLSSPLHNQVLSGRYDLDSFSEKEGNIFVECGFARNKWNWPVIDEPLAILAVLYWVNQTTSAKRDWPPPWLHLPKLPPHL